LRCVQLCQEQMPSQRLLQRRTVQRPCACACACAWLAAHDSAATVVKRSAIPIMEASPAGSLLCEILGPAVRHDGHVGIAAPGPHVVLLWYLMRSTRIPSGRWDRHPRWRSEIELQIAFRISGAWCEQETRAIHVSVISVPDAIGWALFDEAVAELVESESFVDVSPDLPRHEEGSGRYSGGRWVVEDSGG
jgi:hypothetical protein